MTKRWGNLAESSLCSLPYIPCSLLLLQYFRNHMTRTKWTERTFTFDFPEGWMFNILERLRGTTARITWITFSLSEEVLTYKPEGKWSIKEEIGHLIDLEELHIGRIEDFLARKEILRAADMSNQKTLDARHNERKLEDLLSEFAMHRNQFVSRLEELDDETYLFKSFHPRLQVMMRPVDVAYFTAEHDDHHLSTMRERTLVS